MLALDKLNTLVFSGVEFPDALYKVITIYKLKPSQVDALVEAYDTTTA